MTLPFERTNAIIDTKDFLLRLIDPKATPKVPRKIRREALALLKHYPSRLDMEQPENSLATAKMLKDGVEKLK